MVTNFFDCAGLGLTLLTRYQPFFAYLVVCRRSSKLCDNCTQQQDNLRTATDQSTRNSDKGNGKKVMFFLLV